MKKRKFLVFLLVACLCLGNTVLAAPAEDSVISESVYVVDESLNVLEKNEILEEIIATAKENDAKMRGEYDWVYSYEYGASRYKSIQGYAGNQPSAGVRFASPGGAFYWKPEGGPQVSVNVSFSLPFKSVSFAGELGVSASSNDEDVAYIQFVDDCVNNVKLYVIRTYEIEPYIVTRTNRYTGVEEVYLTSAFISTYSYAFQVKKV